MKQYLQLAGALCLLAPCALLAQTGAKGYESKTYPTVTFKAKSGDMGTGRNWSAGKAPSEPFTRVHIPGGCTVSVSKPYPGEFSAVLLGMQNEKMAKMYIDRGGDISVGVFLVPFVNTKEYNAELIIQGGQLIINNTAEKTINSAGYIGSSGTVSGTGVLRINDGTLSGTLFVGSSISNTQVGSLIIQGSKPVVSAREKKHNFIDVRQSGTIEFVLDELGVATIDLKKSSLRMWPGSTIRVNGSDYKAGPKTILLVESEKIVRSDTVKLETTGFPPTLEASIAYTRKGVELKITKAK